MSEKERDVLEIEEIEIPVPEPGKVVKGKVVRIERGKLGELVDIERIRNEVVRKRFEENAHREAIKLVVSLGDTEFEQTFLFSLHPRSNLVRLMKKYGKIRKGMEVDVTFNERGRPKILVD